MKKCLFTLLIGCMLVLNSCVVSKKTVYVRDMLPDTTYSALGAPALRIQKSDRLSIVVSANTPELAVPFNQGMSANQMSEDGNLFSGSTTSLNAKGYLVDDRGEIEFPILGTFLVEGLTLKQVKEMIKRQLMEDELINHPIVEVELLNLKISMMGEVRSVGVLSVPDARITILEAITRAGGLTVNAAADKITVIRQEDGERKLYVHNIQSKDIFNSPTFYLQQNDIVYIEPVGAELTPRAQNNWRYLTSGLGLVATVFTILTFLK